MEYVTLDDILALREELVQARAAYGDGDRYNIRTIDGLMSALAAPQRAAFGTERFPSLAEKAGALVYALVQNHPFWDGNKRIAAAALRLFVQRNAAHIDASDQELQQFTTRIARGDMHDSDLQAWLAKHLEVRT
jgi:death-on-curing protein